MGVHCCVHVLHSGVHGQRMPPDGPIEMGLLPADVVLDRVGHHRLLVGEPGRGHCTVQDFSTRQPSVSADQRVRVSQPTIGFVRQRPSPVPLRLLLVLRHHEIPPAVPFQPAPVVVQPNDASCSGIALRLPADVLGDLSGLSHAVLSDVHVEPERLRQPAVHSSHALRDEHVQIRRHWNAACCARTRPVVLDFVRRLRGVRLLQYVCVDRERCFSTCSKGAR